MAFKPIVVITEIIEANLMKLVYNWNSKNIPNKRRWNEQEKLLYISRPKEKCRHDFSLAFPSSTYTSLSLPKAIPANSGKQFRPRTLPRLVLHACQHQQLTRKKNENQSFDFSICQLHVYRTKSIFRMQLYATLFG